MTFVSEDGQQVEAHKIVLISPSPFFLIGSLAVEPATDWAAAAWAANGPDSLGCAGAAAVPAAAAPVVEEFDITLGFWSMSAELAVGSGLPLEGTPDKSRELVSTVQL